MITSKNEHGFTVTELIVTIIVAGMFMAIVTQMNGSIINIAVDSHRKEMASNLAYNNLRLYANGRAPHWFICNGDDVGDTEAASPFTDGTRYPNATGQLLINTTSSTSISDLPPPVIQRVTAVAPYGCGNTISGMPVRVVSTVTYGSPARKVNFATYVGY